MSMPNIQNQKWLNDIELLDTTLEPTGSAYPAHLNEYFQKLADVSACTDISNEIIKSLAQELKTVVPWFLQQMPPLYLWSTSQTAIVDDILEIISGKVLAEKQIAERYNSSTQTCALIASGENASGLFRIIPRLSQFKSKTVRIFNTIDKKLALCEVYQAPYTPVTDSLNDKLSQKLNTIKKCLCEITAASTSEIHQNKTHKKQSLTPREAFLQAMDMDYLETATIKQVLLDYAAVDYCTQNENAYINVVNVYDEMCKNTRARIDIGMKNFPVNAAIENTVGIFNRYGYQVRRVIANEIRLSDSENFTVLHLVVANQDGTDVTSDTRTWSKIYKNLKALVYVDNDDEFSKLLQGENPPSLNETNLIRAMANWIHIFLTKQNPYYYSLDRVSKVILNHQQYMELSIRYFRAMFSPRLNEGRQRFVSECYTHLQNYINEVIDSVERSILKEGINFLKNILKTNSFLISKGGLTFRMNPEVLNKEFYPETPFGFFLHDWT